MKKQLIKQVKKHFKALFNTKPLMVFSPGRINLIGEHTDYNDGFVFPAAINKGIALAIQKSLSNNSEVHALDINEQHSFQFEAISEEPIANGGWRNYVLGVVAEIQKMGLHVPNFNAVFAGNIPSGSGMSSSAALENSFVFGLNTLFDLGLSKHQMILISQKAEHNFAGVQCGIMDQYASMFGVADSALLLDCRAITAKVYRIDLKKYQLMLINTNVKHDLSESAYNNRRLVCENVAKKLKVKALRDASLEDLKSIENDISEDEFKKASYVIEENQRVIDFSEAIESHNTTVLGSLLYESHEGLRQKYEVSCTELDFLIDEAKKHPQILGARMMGGGFGGCTINIILKSEFQNFKTFISEQYQTQFNKNCDIYKVKLSKGTHLID